MDGGDGDVFVGHEPCPECGSSNNLGRWDDGHAHCFTDGCDYYEPPTDQPDRPAKRKREAPVDLIRGEYRDLAARGITEQTCRKFGYQFGRFGREEKPCQIANYYDDEGNAVAQKVRFKDKGFKFIGEPKKAGLYGMHLWRSAGRMVVVTEGELDALSVSQLQQNKWPVVSVPNGADSAPKAFAKHIDWLEAFDRVVIMFDMDEPGQNAARRCAAVLSPGKAYIARLPLKDANACLQEGKGADVISAMWDAQPWRPDGVVNGADLKERLRDRMRAPAGLPLPWPGVNDKIKGLREAEVLMMVAGTGVGKSALTGEIEYHYANTLEKKVGVIRLEEDVERAGLRAVGIHLNKPLHLPDQDVSDEDFNRAFDETLGTGRYVYNDHFGCLEDDTLLSRMRYMVKADGCEVIILDHISLIASGADLNEDERRLLDNVMTRLRSFSQETGVRLVVVSHLKRPDGKGHEDGGQTSLSQLRGSAALAQLSDTVIGAERNQQADSEKERNTTVVRVLKCRITGFTGPATRLEYDHATGRLKEIGLEECPFPEDDEDGDF